MTRNRSAVGVAASLGAPLRLVGVGLPGADSEQRRGRLPDVDAITPKAEPGSTSALTEV